ncbi:hypothetical protein ALC57_07926, partial [Trachymyrmex cornetzi]
DDECIFPLLDRAYITATTSLPERGPNNARLHGEKEMFVYLVFTYRSCLSY